MDKGAPMGKDKGINKGIISTEQKAKWDAFQNRKTIKVIAFIPPPAPVKSSRRRNPAKVEAAAAVSSKKRKRVEEAPPESTKKSKPSNPSSSARPSSSSSSNPSSSARPSSSNSSNPSSTARPSSSNSSNPSFSARPDPLKDKLKQPCISGVLLPIPPPRVLSLNLNPGVALASSSNVSRTSSESAVKASEEKSKIVEEKEPSWEDVKQQMRARARANLEIFKSEVVHCWPEESFEIMRDYDRLTGRLKLSTALSLIQCRSGIRYYS